MNTKVYEAAIESLGARKMAFTISTGSVDRDGDTINPTGWQLDNYRKNPVVLFAHRHDELPIARAVKIWTTPSGLQAEVEFPPVGTYPFADTVHDMVKAGFLNATSVGFAPKEQTRAADRERGYDFTSQELLEFSIVPIPCNPEATVMRRGINSPAVRSWLASTDTKIDWHAISGELANRVDLDRRDVLAAIERTMPALREAVRDEIKSYAARGAREAYLYMTGRLD